MMSIFNYPRDSWDGAMMDLLGLFFIVFRFFKILDLNCFPESLQMNNPLVTVVPAYGIIYTFNETALGLMFWDKNPINVPVWEKHSNCP